jgi:hypothetical protein
VNCCDSHDDLRITRRHFFGLQSTGIGVAALASLFARDLRASEPVPIAGGQSGLPGFPNFAPKAKRLIYLFQSGGPSQL